MPIKTRAMAHDEKFEQLLALMKEMKASQEEMKKEMLERQEKMEACQEEMKAGQEEMERKIFSGQEEMEKKIFSGQEEMKKEISEGREEMKASQEEMKKEIFAGQEALKNHLLTMEESVKQIEEKFEGKFENVEKKIKNVEVEFKDIEKKIEILEKKDLEGNLSEIQEKLDEMLEKRLSEEKLDEMLEKRLSEEKLDELLEKRLSEEKLDQTELEKRLLELEKRLSSRTVSEDSKCVPVTSRPSIKLSTYDGKSSWQVYKTQFSIVANANGWDSVTKACQLAASLRAEAADILQTLPEEQRLDFNALSSALELRFGEKCMKDYSRLKLKSRQQTASETLQEFATDVDRLSHLAFSDCPAETREILSLQYFVDGIRDVEIQKALLMADVKDLKSALEYAMKYEAAQQATRRERHPLRAAAIQEPEHPISARMEELERQVNNLRQNIPEKKQNLKCWHCGGEGHIRRNCRTRQDTGGKTAPRREEGN